MDFAALDASLTVTDGVFVLAADTLPGTDLADLLARNNAGQPIRITQAVKREPKRVGSGSRDSIPITGVTTFLNVPDLPVEALFSLDGSGSPVFLIRFTLDARTGVGQSLGWHFSTSFPDLPTGKVGAVGETDATPPATAAASGPLGGLTLSNPTFVLSSHTVMDGQVQVSAGLNFVSGVDPAPLYGALASIVGAHGGGGPILHGPVHLPLPTEVTPPLAPGSRPWTAGLAPEPAPAPGLTLRVGVAQPIDIPGIDVHVRDAAIVLYWPISKTWLAANPSYQPSVGLTGTLNAPALVPGPILLTADIPFGWSSATLTAAFTGASLANLTGLGGLLGHANLFAELPAPLRTAGQALGGISLLFLAFRVAIDDRGIRLDSAQAVVGLPTLDYAVGDLVTLTGLQVSFVAVPAAAGGGGFSTSVLVGGTGTIPALGATFDVELDVTQDYAYGTLSDATLPLASVFRDLALPAPADLVIDSAQITIDPGAAYELDAMIADAVPWTLDLGPVPVTVQDIVVVAAKIVGEPTTATFAGRITFGSSVEVAVLYRLPGAFVITGTFQSVSLADLVAGLTDAAITLPAGFDLQIDQAYVCIDSVGGGLRFTASALIDGFGTLAFTASRSAGHWRFAAGMDITEALVNLESIPGLGALVELRSLVGLTELMIVVSSLDDPGFTFPQQAVPPPPDLGFGGPPPALPAQAVGVGEGLTVYGRADLGSSQGIQAIAHWLGVSVTGTLGVTLVVSAPDPGTDSRLFISVSTTVDGIVVTGRLGFALVGRRPEVFLDGTALVNIQGQLVLFSLSAAVAANGVLISGGYQGTIHFDLGAGLGGFTLSNLGLVVGLDWEGIPSFGVAATIDVQTFASSVAVFFDSTDPSKSLLAGSVTQLSLYDVVATIAGQGNVPPALAPVLQTMALKALGAFTLDASVAAALDGRDLAAIATAFAPHMPIASGANQVLLNVGQPGHAWHLTDLTTMTNFSLAATGAGIAVSYDPQLYCAPNDTQIGPNHFPQGFHVQTAVDFFLFSIDRLWVEISPTRGIAADAVIAPIVIGQADLFSITNAAHNGGPTFSIATYTRTAAEQPDPALQPPHILVSGALRLLGTDFGSLYLNISESGVTVQISETVGSGVQVVLAGSATKDSLTLSGTLSVSVGGTIDLGLLGRINVSTDAGGTLSIGFAADSLTATLSASVTLPGLGTLALPPIQLTVTGVPLGQIGSVIWSEIIETVTAAVQDATRWVGFVRDGLIQGIADAKQVAQVLVQQWHLTADAVGGVMHDAGYAANDIAAGMQAVGASAEDVAKTLVGFGYATDVVNSAVGIFGGHTDFNAGHIDTPGGPHGDFHADIGISGSHADSQVPPHGDTGVHVDA